MAIALIDYGAGNLTSVRKALAALNADVFTPAGPDDLARASGLIVPGVGHFGATAVLDDRWKTAIRAAIGRGRPLLGICLGLQWLFEGSDEAPDVPGLGLFPGRCRLLGATGDAAAGAPERLKVPHVGWNTLDARAPAVILQDLPERPQAYFTHSYAAPVTDVCVATTTHGEPFASVVERGQVFGLQFHPEKSASVGLRMLQTFLARAA